VTRIGTALIVLGMAAACVAGYALGRDKDGKKTDMRVFELRTYHIAPGKEKALHARFRDHTINLFKKHEMTLIGFWSPVKPELAEKELVYLLAFPSQEAAAKSWKAFRDDPEWQAVKAASEKEGTLVEKVDSLYLNPTDYSPLQ
jgi:hypothetical protein